MRICRKGRTKNWFTTLLVFVFYRNYILKFSCIAWSWQFRPKAVFTKAISPTGNSLVKLTIFTYLSSSPVFFASLSSYGPSSVQFERPNVSPSCHVMLAGSAAPAEHRGVFALLSWTIGNQFSLGLLHHVRILRWPVADIAIYRRSTA